MSEVLILSGLFLGVLLALYLIGVHVAIAMLATSIVIMVIPQGPGFDGAVINSQLLHGINSFGLLAIPFYVLLGRLMNSAGMTEALFDLANSVVSWARGGIVYVNILASMLFSGMSGLALADAAGLGRVEYTAMRDYGYEKDIAIGVTGSSALVGPIIPPSVPIILYAVLAEESIGELFLAGILPGIAIGIILTLFVFIIIAKRGYEKGAPFELDRFLKASRGALIASMIPIIVIGGLLVGIFTATEAGAVAVIYILIAAAYLGNITLGKLWEEITDSMVETFSLTFIIAAATVYGLVALQLRLPMLLTDWITEFTTDPTTVLFLLAALFLIIGTFMSVTASITILTPILIPVIELVGIDPVHFGIVMVFTLMIGTLTPPFGVLLFVLEKVTDATLEEVIVSIIPYYIPVLLALVLIILFPEAVTFIPYELVE